MGSPTPEDDPTRAGSPGPGQGGWPPPGQQGGQHPPAGQYPGPGQGGQYPPPGPYPGQQPPYPQGPPPTAQFPAAGGPPGQGYPPGGQYPPQGPGGGYGGGYGGGFGAPPPDGGGKKRGLLIAVVVGLVLLAVLAVALVIAFTRDGGDTVAADPSETTSEAPSSSASPSPSESSSAAPSPTESADRTDELLAAVPADFTDCQPRELAGDGDVAAVECGPSTTQPGPQTAAFYLYEDTATLDEVFAAEAEGVPPMPEGEDCTTSEGVTTWNVDGVEGGEVGCVITEDQVLIAWSDREFGIEGIVTAPGTTQEDLAALAQWWATNSDFQG